MGKGFVILSLMLLSNPTLSAKTPQVQTSDSASVNSSENENRLRAWLRSTGLGQKFDIIRTGEGPYPDPQFAFDGMVQHLELRFKTTGSERAKEAGRFQKLLADYQRDHASSLPEKLLYEFANTFAIDSRNACVDLHLLDVLYYVCGSRVDGSLIVLRGDDRAAYDTFSVTIPAVAPQEQFHARLENRAALNPQVVGSAVEKFLKTYLDSIQSKSGPKAEILTDVHRQDGYLRLLVNGAKGIVTDGYWEWMDIAVFFHQNPAVEKGKDPQWDFVCNAEVKYASSQHETRPTDADFDYPRQVAQFRTRLGQQLQAHLEKGIHD